MELCSKCQKKKEDELRIGEDFLLSLVLHGEKEEAMEAAEELIFRKTLNLSLKGKKLCNFKSQGDPLRDVTDKDISRTYEIIDLLERLEYLKTLYLKVDEAI